MHSNAPDSLLLRYPQSLNLPLPSPYATEDRNSLSQGLLSLLPVRRGRTFHASQLQWPTPAALALSRQGSLNRLSRVPLPMVIAPRAAPCRQALFLIDSRPAPKRYSSFEPLCRHAACRSAYGRKCTLFVCLASLRLYGR